MLSKAQNKYIRSLTQQKYRKENNVFIAEGDKIAREWLQSDAAIQMIVADAGWADSNREYIDRHPEASVHIVEEHILESISALQTPNHVLLVVHIPEYKLWSARQEWCIALDDIQDPGNMGTIIRIADWFGIKFIALSQGCVDVYNPKVVQAAMGSHLRVETHTVDLATFLQHTSMPILAAALDGESIYSLKKPEHGVLVIGNESKGISPAIMKLATNKITIPRLGGAESLNAAVSTGILCSALIAPSRPSPAANNDLSSAAKGKE